MRYDQQTMPHDARRTLPNWVGMTVTVIAFAVAVWFAKTYQTTLVTLGSASPMLGVVGYVAILIAEVIAAPISSAPLVPIASAIWGPFTAGTLTLIGWTLGSIVAFELVRFIGRPTLARFIDLSRAEQLIHRWPTGDLTLGILAIRLSVPIDLVSYALGLVPGISLRPYVVGTVLGYAPYAYLWASVGSGSWWGILVTIGGGVGLLSWIHWGGRRRLTN